MPAERMASKEKAKLNIGISPEVATALRKYALEKTGTMRGISSVVEEALVEYLKKTRCSDQPNLAEQDNQRDNRS